MHEGSTIKAIAGHVSRQMLARYSHIRMNAKRKALEAIVKKPEPAPQTPQPTKEEKPAKAQPISSPDSTTRAPGPQHRPGLFDLALIHWKMY